MTDPPKPDPDRFAKVLHGADNENLLPTAQLWEHLTDRRRFVYRRQAAAVLAAQGEPCAWTRAGRAYREEHGPNPSGPPIAEVEAHGSVAVHLWALGWWAWELEHDVAKARNAYEAEKKRADGLLERALRAERAAQGHVEAGIDREQEIKTG